MKNLIAQKIHALYSNKMEVNNKSKNNPNPNNNNSQNPPQKNKNSQKNNRT